MRTSMQLLTNLKVILLALALMTSNTVFSSSASEQDHEKSGHGDEGSHEKSGHEEEGEQSIKLTPVRIKMAGIMVTAIQPQAVPDVIQAPGEIVLNAYKTTLVTPRVSAQVVQRHAKLGDDIAKGQPLLTLSSVEMATAQGDLLVSGREWNRVKKLGKKVVSGQRYTKARVAHEQAKARVLAYGMTSEQSRTFLKNGNAADADGSFQLLAPQDGTIISDDFIVGELIEPGRKLFTISDESVLWVEAKLTPSQAKGVLTESSVTIIANDKKYTGKVVQIHHALDEKTRTLGVRIEVANPDDDLHAGFFVQTHINGSNTEQSLAIPLTAVLKSPDGDWVIFTEHEAGEFEPKEVELVRTVGELAVIAGIEPGTRVVTQGAFFVQSELAKSGFSIHNH